MFRCSKRSGVILATSSATARTASILDRLYVHSVGLTANQAKRYTAVNISRATQVEAGARTSEAGLKCLEEGHANDHK